MLHAYNPSSCITFEHTSLVSFLQLTPTSIEKLKLALSNLHEHKIIQRTKSGPYTLMRMLANDIKLINGIRSLEWIFYGCTSHATIAGNYCCTIIKHTSFTLEKCWLLWHWLSIGLNIVQFPTTVSLFVAICIEALYISSESKPGCSIARTHGNLVEAVQVGHVGIPPN